MSVESYLLRIESAQFVHQIYVQPPTMSDTLRESSFKLDIGLANPLEKSIGHYQSSVIVAIARWFLSQS